MPTFEFRQWLVDLSLAVVICFALTPLAAKGVRWLRPLGLAVRRDSFAQCGRAHGGNDFGPHGGGSHVSASGARFLFFASACDRIRLADGSGCVRRAPFSHCQAGSEKPES